jgi:hypothetical protein
MGDYDLLTPKEKVLVWILEHTPEPVSDKIYDFYYGFYRFSYAFKVWGAIMTTDYETTNRKTFGWTWYDEFYGLLGRNYDYYDHSN